MLVSYHELRENILGYVLHLYICTESGVLHHFDTVGDAPVTNDFGNKISKSA